MSHIRWLPILLLLLVGCTQSPAKPASQKASEKPRSESDLAFTNITKKAYVALQIKTQPIAIQNVHERLTLTGWIMAKPGNEVTLTAPAAGYVHFPKGHSAPIAGDTVKVGQELLQIQPVLSPVEQIQVAALKRGIETELIKAQATLKTAESDYTRIRDLHAQNLRSKQELELAQKAHDHAIEELAGAKDKLKYFDLPPVSIKAPQQGTILLSPIGAGQYVAASAPLVTIIDLQPVWIRVPVPEFDLPRIDPRQSVTISMKDVNHDKSAFLHAKPVGRVAQVDPLKHTAELWYELEPTKDANRFVKDQMVTVHLALGKTEKADVVPYSALLFDTHGHAWIYLERTSEKDTKHQFERRPVEMVNSTDDGIIIRTTLTGGERVVTNGAAVLFSRDFHKTPVPEDD
jgi:RND family efflux transporter MFP subunit